MEIPSEILSLTKDVVRLRQEAENSHNALCEIASNTVDKTNAVIEYHNDVVTKSREQKYQFKDLFIQRLEQETGKFEKILARRDELTKNVNLLKGLEKTLALLSDSKEYEYKVQIILGDGHFFGCKKIEDIEVKIYEMRREYYDLTIELEIPSLDSEYVVPNWNKQEIYELVTAVKNIDFDKEWHSKCTYAQRRVINKSLEILADQALSSSFRDFSKDLHLVVQTLENGKWQRELISIN